MGIRLCSLFGGKPDPHPSPPMGGSPGTPHKIIKPCCRNAGFADRVDGMIAALDLPDYNKEILRRRFVAQVNVYSSRRFRYGLVYHPMRTFISIGSICVAAVLAAQGDTPTPGIYWGTWAASLTVSVFASFLQLFKMDEAYWRSAVSTEKLKLEGWQFFGLSGRYNRFHSHEEAFAPFCSRVEYLKARFLSQEYLNAGRESSSKGEHKHSGTFLQGQRDVFASQRPITDNEADADFSPISAAVERQRPSDINTIGSGPHSAVEMTPRESFDPDHTRPPALRSANISGNLTDEEQV